MKKRCFYLLDSSRIVKKKIPPLQNFKKKLQQSIDEGEKSANKH